MFQSFVSGPVEVSLTHDPLINLDLVVVGSGASATCGPSGCIAAGTAAIQPETLLFYPAIGDIYHIIVEGPSVYDVGSFTLDVDCAGGLGVEDCGNLVDDDGDGFIDCADPNCAALVECRPAENCYDNIDNNGFGGIDCADFFCSTSFNCLPEICNDGFDNDLDLLPDCQDPDCQGVAPCP